MVYISHSQEETDIAQEIMTIKTEIDDCYYQIDIKKKRLEKLEKDIEEIKSRNMMASFIYPSEERDMEEKDMDLYYENKIAAVTFAKTSFVEAAKKIVNYLRHVEKSSKSNLKLLLKDCLDDPEKQIGAVIYKLKYFGILDTCNQGIYFLKK